jgi:RNA polymerase sigma-70 factor, ECF subfamily
MTEPAQQPEYRASSRADPEPRDARAVWRAHRRWVAAILLAHKPREADVEDLLQEVALRLVKHWGEVAGAPTLKPWLRTVAVNVARTAGRRASVRREARLEVAPACTESRAPPETRSWGGEDARELLDRAMELPEQYREPLLLKAVRGLTYQQIGQVLDLPVSTIESRLVRARRMLREQVACERVGVALGSER